MQKISAELSSAVKKIILINKWLNLEFPYFFNTSCTFWPNSILFRGLENRFHNSVLLQNRVGTLKHVLWIISPGIKTYTLKV